MRTYLLTAAGVIFLSVIASLLIPEGKLNKSIVFVIRIVCIFVLIQPIKGIFNIETAPANQTLCDYTYICKVYSENQSEQLEKLILKEFSEQSDCEVKVVFEDGNFKISGVTVELQTQSEKIIEEIYEYLEQSGYINISVYAKSY